MRTTRTRQTMAVCVALAALVGVAGEASAQGRDRREVRQFAVAAPWGGSIGVQVKDLTPEELAKARTQSGAAVVDVVEDSPAQKAGLKAGDIVIEFDGERVRGARQFARLVEDTPEGRAVKVVVSRAGSKQTMEVTPVTRRGEMAWLEDLGPRVREGVGRGMRRFEFDAPVAPGILVGPNRPRLGVGVEPLGDQLAAYFGVKDGVLVASVEADSPAAKAGLKAGDVITAVNGESIADPGDLTAEVRKAAPGSTLSLEIVRERKTQTLKATLPDARRRTPVRDRLTARRI
ncbi:MAG: PDZ domain-containing protein [Vicinamibacterales bacterium]